MAAKKGKTRVFVTPWFGSTYRSFKKTSPKIEDALTTFNKCKRTNQKLPNSMKDHALKGKLSDYRECHLAPNILLIYQHANKVLSFLHICEHDDLGGGKAASLAKKIKSCLN
jgi:mRNA interferase YafQ